VFQPWSRCVSRTMPKPESAAACGETPAAWGIGWSGNRRLWAAGHWKSQMQIASFRLVGGQARVPKSEALPAPTLVLSAAPCSKRSNQESHENETNPEYFDVRCGRWTLDIFPRPPFILHPPSSILVLLLLFLSSAAASVPTPATSGRAVPALGHPTPTGRPPPTSYRMRGRSGPWRRDRRD